MSLFILDHNEFKSCRFYIVLCPDILQEPDYLKRLPFKEVTCDFHVYHLEEEEIQAEELDAGGDGCEKIAAANYCLLPHASFNDIWENLIFDSNIKEKVNVETRFAILK